jgi:hypothetical protein
MNLWKRLVTGGLAAGAIALTGGLVGCTVNAVYDPGGPYPDNTLYTPSYGYYQPYYYYTEPRVGVYYYDRDGHRHYGHYDEHEAREWREHERYEHHRR